MDQAAAEKQAKISTQTTTPRQPPSPDALFREEEGLWHVLPPVLGHRQPGPPLVVLLLLAVPKGGGALVALVTLGGGLLRLVGLGGVVTGWGW